MISELFVWSLCSPVMVVYCVLFKFSVDRVVKRQLKMFLPEQQMLGIIAGIESKLVCESYSQA